MQNLLACRNIYGNLYKTIFGISVVENFSKNKKAGKKMYGKSERNW